MAEQRRVGGVGAHGLQRGDALIRAEHRAALGFAVHGGMDGEHGHLRQHRRVGVERERQPLPHRASGGIKARRPIRAEEDVPVPVAPVPDVQPVERGQDARLLHAPDVLVGRHLAMDDQMPGVLAGAAGLRPFHRRDDGFDGPDAVAVDGKLAAPRMPVVDHLVPVVLRADDARPERGVEEIPFGDGGGPGLDGAVRKRLDRRVLHEAVARPVKEARGLQPAERLLHRRQIDAHVQLAGFVQLVIGAVLGFGAQVADAHRRVVRGGEALCVVLRHALADEGLVAFLIQRGHELAHGLESHLFRNVPVGQAVLAEEHVHVVERRVRVDADALQRLRVGVAGMPRNVEDQHGTVGHHRIKLPLGRAAPFGDVGIVEIVDHNPVVAPHPFGLPADQGVHVLEVRDARTAAVRFPHGVQRGVAVRVDEAGVEGRALEVDGPAAGPGQRRQPVLRAHGFDDGPGHKHRLGDGPGGVHRDDPPIRVQRLFNAPHKELLEDNT